MLRSRSSVRVAADDPPAVAHAVIEATGARLVPAPEVPAWTAEARLLRTLAERVRVAEAVVVGAVAADREGDVALMVTDAAPEPAEPAPAPSPAPSTVFDGAAADRQALRFALVILVLAQIGGAAVYAVDGDLLAIAAPAGALVVVAGIVLAHRRPVPVAVRAAASPAPVEPEVATVDPVGPPGSPAVRAAEAHLRRQQAAWKLAWWERGLTPATVADWSNVPADGIPPATLLIVDEGGELDALHAELAAAVPAAVRVVLVVPRASPPAAAR